MKKSINTVEAPVTINYCQAIEMSNTIHLSGQIPLNPETMEIIGQDIVDQMTQILKNIEVILKAANYSLNNTIKIIIYLENIDDFSKINKIYRKYFENIELARTLLEVSRLPKNSKVMIDLIASK